MVSENPINPKLTKLYEAAKRLAAAKAKAEKLRKTLELWPTKKEPGK